MKDVNDAVNKATEQVYEQVRLIEAHNATLGCNFSVAPGAPDPYVEQARRQEAIDNASEAAKEAILKPSILRYICPALSSVTGDVFEISKILVGVLVPLSIAGAIAIAWNPLVIAAGAFLITRAGITSICKDVDIKESKK